MRVVSLVDSPMLIEGILRRMGMWDSPPSPPCRGPPDMIGEGTGPDADTDWQPVPFLGDRAFPNYGGEGDFRS